METNQNSQPTEKRGRGRPRKHEVVEKPPKKANGRPRKYPEGCVAHHYPKITVDRKEYHRLLEIEKKYNELKNIIV